MVDAALAGMWLGQRHGDDLWGSNLYLQTVSAVLDVPMPWELAHAAVEEWLISLDGAVLGLPQPIRTAPVGPVMDWDSTEATDGDWVVWWSRLDGQYQVEVTRDPDNTSRANRSTTAQTTTPRFMPSRSVWRTVPSSDQTRAMSTSGRLSPCES
ncbi:hypothetical protein G6010_13070 [Dietzia sp. SLG510A3-3B2-2]|nr:hypothetical protein [Dietzia sp. SLG510A3-40A3]MBB1010410.1 hypothetical protein [Dietzia sp. SLG510A3-3B2-2]